MSVNDNRAKALKSVRAIIEMVQEDDMETEKTVQDCHEAHQMDDKGTEKRLNSAPVRQRINRVRNDIEELKCSNQPFKLN